MFDYRPFALTAVARCKMLQNRRRLNVTGMNLCEAAWAQDADLPRLGYVVGTRKQHRY